MWPLDLLRQRKYDRHYKAAIAVLLAQYGQLSADDRARVELSVQENYDNCDLGPKVAEWRPTVLAAERAAAMQRLRMGTGIPGLTWDELFAPWRRGPANWLTRMAFGTPYPFSKSAWDERAYLLEMDFRLGAQATMDARDFLCRHGIHIPKHDPFDPSTLLTEDQIRRRKPS